MYNVIFSQKTSKKMKSAIKKYVAFSRFFLLRKIPKQFLHSYPSYHKDCYFLTISRSLRRPNQYYFRSKNRLKGAEKNRFWPFTKIYDFGLYSKKRRLLLFAVQPLKGKVFNSCTLFAFYSFIFLASICCYCLKTDKVSNKIFKITKRGPKFKR